MRLVVKRTKMRINLINLFTDQYNEGLKKCPKRCKPYQHNVPH